VVLNQIANNNNNNRRLGITFLKNLKFENLENLRFQTAG
jgi:hypothetical protein